MSDLDIFNMGQQEFITDKGARWFLQQGSSTAYNKGFTSKVYASLWIESLGRKVDWRAGYVFRLRGGKHDMQIVNRSGNLAKN